MRRLMRPFESPWLHWFNPKWFKKVIPTEVLSLKAQALLDALHLEPLHFAPGLVAGLPDQVALGCRDLQRCADLVGVEVLEAVFFAVCVIHPRQRCIAVGFINIQLLAAAAGLLQQAQALPEELRGGECPLDLHLLVRASAQGIVLVSGFVQQRAIMVAQGMYQAVLAVVFK